MFYGAKNGSLKIGDSTTDYVFFGKGNKNLIIIPGLGDGLKTVKGMAFTLSVLYRKYANDYKVYFISRKNTLSIGASTRDMAKDLKIAMDTLGIDNADVMGLSQGGMISQFLAIDYPEKVNKLIIGVSVSRQNDVTRRVIGNWKTLAENNDYKHLFIDSLEKTYTHEKVKKYRPFYPILSRLGKPKDFSRFIIQAQSCIEHNAYEELKKIRSQTLVIGGDRDMVVGKNSSEEIAEKIPNSRLFICKGLGHGAFEEKIFNQQVLAFLKSNDC